MYNNLGLIFIGLLIILYIILTKWTTEIWQLSQDEHKKNDKNYYPNFMLLPSPTVLILGM